MLITRNSDLTNKENSMEIPIGESHYKVWLMKRTPVQKEFPFLTEEQCMFLLSGTTQEEWNNYPVLKTA